MKSLGLLPKTGASQGNIYPEWKRCGKSCCRCARGVLHGPYWYRRWREADRQRKQYVPRDRVATELALQALRQRDRPTVCSMTRMLTELRRLEQEIYP